MSYTLNQFDDYMLSSLKYNTPDLRYYITNYYPTEQFLELLKLPFVSERCLALCMYYILSVMFGNGILPKCMDEIYENISILKLRDIYMYEYIEAMTQFLTFMTVILMRPSMTIV